MVPTIAPDSMGYMAIATKERDRIQDNMPSPILNIVSQPGTPGSSTAASAASSSGNDAEVGFQFSDVKKSSFSYALLSPNLKNRVSFNGIGLDVAWHPHLREAGKYRADSSSDRVWSRECNRQG